MKKLSAVLSLFLLFVFSLSALDYVWVEAEDASSFPKITPSEKDANDKGYNIDRGKAEWQSGGKSVLMNISDKEVSRVGEGAIYSYAFSAPSDGSYNFWARLGYADIKSPMDYRIDSGTWRELGEPIIQNIQVLMVWNDISWYEVGAVDLSKGKHTLDIRVRPKIEPDNKGNIKPKRLLFRADCFAFVKGEFVPNYKHKPDANYQDEEDKKAASTVFSISEAKGDERVEAKLNGLWQIAPWEEFNISEATRLGTSGPYPSDPEKLKWYGIKVPGNLKYEKKEILNAQRYLYRTKVAVPASMKGRSFQLEFDAFSMVATVYVNGIECGTSKEFMVPWKCDITKAVKPGEKNEIAVAIKSIYYGFSPIQINNNDIRSKFHFEQGLLQNSYITYGIDMPWAVKAHNYFGIMESVYFVSSGEIYTEHTFIKTSVKNKQLDTTFWIKNTTEKTGTITIENKAVSKSGKAEKAFKNITASIKAYDSVSVELSEKWDNPEFWWPDSPHLYDLVTTIKLNGKTVDVKKTTFGFRELEWKNRPNTFLLNGISWQFWTDLLTAPKDYSIEEKIAFMKKNNLNNVRLWGSASSSIGSVSQRDFLDTCDREGMVVRRSGYFDGELASYTLQVGEGANMPLMNNWLEHMAAEVKAEWNHPSIVIWSLENEITYVNSKNLGKSEIFEPEAKRVSKAIQTLDPTRPTMFDGGRVLEPMASIEEIGVIGTHYNGIREGQLEVGQCPDILYDIQNFHRSTKKRGRWESPKDRPFWHGEIFFMNGWTTAKLASLVGEEAFQGPTVARAKSEIMAKMQNEAFRWNRVGAWHFWGEWPAGGPAYNALSPVAVFCRNWNWSFESGKESKRTLMVFNSTRFSTPIEMEWILEVEGKKVAGEKKTYNIPAGETSGEFEIAFTPPQIKEPSANGKFILRCEREGKEVYKEEYAVHIINNSANELPSFKEGEIAVLERFPSVSKYLEENNIPFIRLRSGKDALDLPQKYPNTKILIVGHATVPENASTDPAWFKLLLSGIRVIVLEQVYPLAFQAIPSDASPTKTSGRVAFSQDLTHPLMKNLKQQDFYTWSGDHLLYRHAYEKPTLGGRSLIHCDWELKLSALIESTVKDGLMILAQMAIGTKLATDPVARRLFDNMLIRAKEYKYTPKKSIVLMDANDNRAKLLDSQQLVFDNAKRVSDIFKGDYEIAIVDATPKNLKELATEKKKIEEFTENGGWLMLWGVTPEGIEDYNKIVGVEHLIRPFQFDRVGFTVPRDPLTAGITMDDVMMLGDKFGWFTGIRKVVDDAFTYVLDYDDVAPFSTITFGNDTNYTKQMVNGFTTDTYWWYVFSVVFDNTDIREFSVDFEREETITSISIAPNAIYYPMKKINVFVDSDPKPIVLDFDTSKGNERTDFPIEKRKAKNMRFVLAEWEEIPGKRGVIGIDNLWIKTERSEEFYEKVKPLFTVGTVIRYNMGKGGILLNQLNIQAMEKFPENKQKKVVIARSLLANLGADLGGATPVVVGSGLKFEPVKISAGKAQPNAFIKQHSTASWFKSREINADFNSLPKGVQDLGGVKYEIYDFGTSDVPSVFMLTGEGSSVGETQIKDIAIDKKCDALFFLHTANPGKLASKYNEAMSINPTGGNEETAREKERLLKQVGGKNGIAFSYTVHYDDNSTIDIPVRWGDSIASWYSDTEPKPMKFASVAYAAQVGGKYIALYSMQWSNPYPDKKIVKIDMGYPSELAKAEGDWGVPALIAVTAASTPK